MERSREHIIQFAGLKDGLHEFEFQLDDEFFGSFNDEDVLHAAFKATAILEKRPEMLELQLAVSGTMTVECDRCSKDLTIPVEGSQRQVFKVSEREAFDNEEIVAITPYDHEVDISPYLYECVKLAVPLRKVHKKKDCDPVAMAALEETSKRDEPKSDPRWDALKALDSPKGQ